MSSGEISSWIQTGAAISQLFLSIATLIAPKIKMLSQVTFLKKIQYPLIFMIGLTVINLTTLAFEYWNQNVEQSFYKPDQLEPENARLEMVQWQKSKPKIGVSEHFGMNLYFINQGKTAATNFNHFGVLIASDKPLSDKEITKAFMSIYVQMATKESEIGPSVRAMGGDVWFTLAGPQYSVEMEKNLENGTNYLYIINLIKYQDETMKNKFIYGETCSYYTKSVYVLCNGAHNRSYISR